MDTDEIIKRWGAAKAQVDDWENLTVEFEGWSQWYSTETGGEDGIEVEVRRGHTTLWSREIKYEVGEIVREILAFGRELESC